MMLQFLCEDGECVEIKFPKQLQCLFVSFFEFRGCHSGVAFEVLSEGGLVAETEVKAYLMKGKIGCEYYMAYLAYDRLVYQFLRGMACLVFAYLEKVTNRYIQLSGKVGCISVKQGIFIFGQLKEPVNQFE